MAPYEPAPPGSRQRQRENGTWVLVVPQEYWISEAEARRLIGGGNLRIANGLRTHRLMQADNPALEAGYLRSTVEREAQRWAHTPRWRRFVRLFWDNL